MKEEGNEAFKSGDFERAYDLYSQALQLDPHNKITNAKLFCNRANAGSKVRSNLSVEFSRVESAVQQQS